MASIAGKYEMQPIYWPEGTRRQLSRRENAERVGVFYHVLGGEHLCVCQGTGPGGFCSTPELHGPVCETMGEEKDLGATLISC